MNQPDNALSARYAKLMADRLPYLQRAREMSRLTIPALFPPEGHTASTILYVPYQSVGARGINNLATKLLLTLLPPNSPFFRYKIDPQAKNQAEQQDPKHKVLTEVQKTLAMLEGDIHSEIEACGFRPQLYEGIRQLVVGGNTLLYIPKGEGKARCFNLTNYVVVREPDGTLDELIVKQCMDKGQLPKDAKALLTKDTDGGEGSKGDDDDVDIYIQIKEVDGRYVVRQELKGGLHVKSGDGNYPNADALPWFPLRLIRIDGEHYGRGYVEEYQGDLQSMEGLSQSLIEGVAVAAKIVFLLKPNASTNKKHLASAENGDVVTGNAEDVAALQVDKHADFQTVNVALGNIEKRLEFAFLLNTAVQRDAERVTAEEIRYMANELESALGGVYSMLAQEFQMRLVKLFIGRMIRSGDLPKLGKDHVKPVIITGIEALGRGNDLDRLKAFIADIAQLATAIPGFTSRVKDDVLITRLAYGHGLQEVDELLKSDDEMAAAAQEQQQQMQQQQMADIASKTIPGIAHKATDAMLNGQNAQQPAPGG